MFARVAFNLNLLRAYNNAFLLYLLYYTYYIELLLKKILFSINNRTKKKFLFILLKVHNNYNFLNKSKHKLAWKKDIRIFVCTYISKKLPRWYWSWRQLTFEAFPTSYFKQKTYNYITMAHLRLLTGYTDVPNTVLW